MNITHAITLAHVVGTIMFIANVVVSAAWKLSAERSRHPTLICFALRQVSRMDLLFGATGAMLILLSGIALVVMKGYSWTSPSVAWGVALFVTACGLWLGVMLPAHNRQSLMSQDIAAGRPIAKLYWRLAWAWHGAALGAAGASLLAVYGMLSAQTQ